MSVYRVKTAVSIARNASDPAAVRCRAGASVASTDHSSAPEPAAISAASVKVGM